MSARLRRAFATGDSGASAVEYGLLVAGIAAVIVTIVFVFGNFINDIFTETCATIGSDENLNVTTPTGCTTT